MISPTFKEKLLNYEVAPPDAAWEHVFSALDESKDLVPISKKLYDYEVIPPMPAWKGIYNMLEEDKKVPIKQIPVKSKYRLLIRVMAAAAFLGIIISGLFIFSGIKSLKNKITSIKTVKPGLKELKISMPRQEFEPASVQTEPEGIQSLPAILSLKIRKNYKESNKVLQNTKIKYSLFPVKEAGIMIAAKPIRNQKGDIIQDTEILNTFGNQYISITGPNGQQTKISSKFLDMLLFINGDSDIDEVEGYFDKNFFESLTWKPRFQEWRNKIIGTSLVPSATNFMDILEFKDFITKDR